MYYCVLYGHLCLLQQCTQAMHVQYVCAHFYALQADGGKPKAKLIRDNVVLPPDLLELIAEAAGSEEDPEAQETQKMGHQARVMQREIKAAHRQEMASKAAKACCLPC